MADELELTEHHDETPDVLPQAPPITDRFLFVDVAAMRAKQLRRGALPRLGQHTDANRDAPLKPERVAMEEVRRGLVHYEVPAFKPRQAEQKI